MSEDSVSSSKPETASIDLQVLESSYRFVSDDSAFEDCLVAWSKKLAKAETENSISPVDNDRFVKGHLLGLRGLLDKLGGPKQANAIVEAVSEIDAPAMVVTPRGIVATLNAEAYERFGAIQGQGNRLEWLDPVSVPDFESVRASAQGQGNRHHAIVRTYDENGVHGIAEVYTLPSNGEENRFIAVRALETLWSTAVDDTLKNAFNLTLAEREVARALYEMRDTTQIAASRNTTLQTIRTQVRTILGKTETASQVDLVRMLGLLNARASHGRRAEQVAWRDPWENQHTLQYPDGKRLAYSWTGAENGVPALIVHGATQGYLLGEQIENRLKEAGVRLYAIIRPGFSESDSYPHSDFQTLQSDAVSWLLDELGLHGIPAIGLGNGSIPLFHLAAERPGLFSRLLVTGLLQPYSGETLARLSPTQRTLARFVRFAPKTAETMARVGDRYIQQKGADWYLARGWNGVPEVEETLANPEIMPLIRNACELTLTAGTWDFVREMQSQWNIDPAVYASVACRVHHLRGEHDRSVTATHVKKVAGQAPNFSSELVQGAGYFLPYEKPGLFADRLIQTVLGGRAALGDNAFIHCDRAQRPSSACARE